LRRPVCARSWRGGRAQSQRHTSRHSDPERVEAYAGRYEPSGSHKAGTCAPNHCALRFRAIFVDAHRITTGRRRGRVNRGGHRACEHLVRDLELWMKQDQGPESWFTTMVDLYLLPPDFPGYTAFLSSWTCNNVYPGLSQRLHWTSMRASPNCRSRGE
jgi:hypothetical protein